MSDRMFDILMGWELGADIAMLGFMLGGIIYLIITRER